MDTASVLASIDAEIAKLEQARVVLAGTAKHKAAATSETTKKRKMSAEARKRIGDAQRKRWAAARAKK